MHALALAEATSTWPEEVACGPLMSTSFLQGLAAQLETLWNRLGFVGQEACDPGGVMRQYLQSGQLPQQLSLPGGAPHDRPPCEAA